MTDAKSFSDLGLSSWIVQQCDSLGLKKPSPVQANCIPPILQGRDCLGCAKTGSGKTAAFALPILQKLSENPYGIFSVILTPTRELAYQIADQFEVFGKSIGVRIVCITGGIDSVQQGLEMSKQPHILISTPGRLADHIESCKTFSFKRVKFLVMDEADRLLEDNFGEQLRLILEQLPRKRQTLLFSATLTDTLKQLQAVSKNDPLVWIAPLEVATVSELDQRYVLAPADMKDAYMFHVLDKWRDDNPTGSVVIFTNTCKYCQILALMCFDLGMKASCLHSALKQRERLGALNRFKSSHVKLLIATDVASRGLDMPMVDLIVNHNVPHRSKDYIHRVGRTARAGRSGQAITMVTQFDINLIHAVEDRINVKLTEHPIDEDEILKIATEVGVARRQAEILLDERDFGEQKEINKRKRLILEGKDPDEINEEKKKQNKRFRRQPYYFKKSHNKLKKKERGLVHE